MTLKKIIKKRNNKLVEVYAWAVAYRKDEKRVNPQITPPSLPKPDRAPRLKKQDRHC